MALLNFPLPGGITITYDFIPDPDSFAQEFDSMAVALNEMAAPLALSMQAFANSVGRAFDTQGANIGNPWPPPARDYGWPLLQRTGAFKAGAMSAGSYLITEREVYFHGGAIPTYGWFHIYGATRSSSALSAQIREEVGADNLSEGFGLNVLPERDPIGLDDQAEKEILAIWEAWFGGIVGGFGVGAGGRFQSRIGGRFGPGPSAFPGLVGAE